MAPVAGSEQRGLAVERQGMTQLQSAQRADVIEGLPQLVHWQPEGVTSHQYEGWSGGSSTTHESARPTMPSLLTEDVSDDAPVADT